MESGDSADSRVSRREVMTLAGTGVVGAAAIGGGSMVLSNTASATMQVETENLEVSSPDGTIEEIQLLIGDAEATYSNIGPEVEGFLFTIYVDEEEVFVHSFHKSQAGSEEAGFDIGPDSGSFPYHSGIDRPGGGEIPLFENSSYGPSDFEVPEDGASESFTLDVNVELGVYTVDGSADDPAVTASGSDSITLTIHNSEDGSNGGGGGGGSDPDPEASMSGVQVTITVELPNGEEEFLTPSVSGLSVSQPRQ